MGVGATGCCAWAPRGLWPGDSAPGPPHAARRRDCRVASPSEEVHRLPARSDPSTALSCASVRSIAASSLEVRRRCRQGGRSRTHEHVSRRHTYQGCRAPSRREWCVASPDRSSAHALRVTGNVRHRGSPPRYLPQRIEMSIAAPQVGRPAPRHFWIFQVAPSDRLVPDGRTW